MTDNVIQFPASEVRAWTEMERVLREGLRANGADRAMVDAIIPRLQDVYTKYMPPVAMDFTVPQGCEQACLAAASKVHVFMRNVVGELFGQILLREIRLYQLEGPAPKEAG